jgi:DNA-binding LacI/PurR family transcriptional regulator
VFEELQKLDISMEFCIIGDDGSIPERLNTEYCDGAIICSEPAAAATRKELHSRLRDIPTVNTFLVAGDGNSEFDLVKFDAGEIARVSMRYFYEHGIKEVAAFPEYGRRLPTKELLDTFKYECERIGILCHDLADTVRDSLPMAEYYKKLVEAFLLLKTAEGMAFVTSADMLGVLNELRAQGVDISRYEYLSAFSCEQTLRYFEKLPPFIDIKYQQLGVMTAKRLLDRIHSFNSLPRTDIVLAPEIIQLD